MTKRFLKETLERAAKTAAQVLVATLGAGAVSVVSMPWLSALYLAAGAAVLSVLTSVASAPWGDEATPSLVRSEDQ